MSIWFYLCLVMKCICFGMIAGFSMVLFESRWSKRWTISVCVALFAVISYLKLGWGAENGNIITVTAWMIMVLYVFYYMICLMGSWKERVLAMFVFVGVECSCDVITHIIITQGLEMVMDNTWNSPKMLFVMLIGTSILLVFEFVTVHIWKWVKRDQSRAGEMKESRRRLNWISMLYYGSVLVYIVCQMIFGVYRSMDMIALGNVTSMLELTGMILGMTGTILTVIFTFDMTRLMQMERELFELDALRKEEQTRYQIFQEEIEATARLRHDYHNYMETVQELFENDPETGEQLLIELYNKAEKGEK